MGGAELSHVSHMPYAARNCGVRKSRPDTRLSNVQDYFNYRESLLLIVRLELHGLVVSAILGVLREFCRLSDHLTGVEDLYLFLQVHVSTTGTFSMSEMISTIKWPSFIQALALAREA